MNYARDSFNSSGVKHDLPNLYLNGMDHQKKGKAEQCEPSKVIHLRSLGNDVHETDVKAFGKPFGNVTNTLHMRNKGQAFIEFDDIETARSMINYYMYVTPMLQSRQVSLQFSNHQELTKRELPASARDEQDQSNAGPVLKVIVSNIVYPVTIEVLQQVFQRCGELQKIVTFTRNEQFHALLQYASDKEALSAKNLFHNQNIYNGCNTLHVDFSKLDNLVVKYNNDKMRDFTRPDPKPLAAEQILVDPVTVAQMQMAAMHANPGMLPNPYSPPCFNPGGATFPGMAHGGFQFPGMAAGMAASMGLPSMHHQMSHLSRGGNVLLVSNLDEEAAKCDDLFILFGHYGDVQRVKILFNKKDTSLIQFSDSVMANAAQQNLNGVKLHGKEMRVSKSKHDNVNMPKAEDEGKELTKDYNNSPLHRFKKPGSKNFQNIFPPIRTLHLSNIPESTTEEDIRELFGKYGTIVNFRFFPKDRRMALIQLECIEESITSLIRVHNHKLSESSHLRVSFAKNEM